MVFSPFLGRCALCAVLLTPALGHADAAGAPVSRWDAMQQTLERTWESNQYELYVPVNIWHNPANYSAQKRASYNAEPWGAGFGKYRYDADGDWHALYAMVFLDSHSDVEPIAGYAFQKIWRPADGWRLGAGFTLGVTLRADYHYLPIPVPLPLVSLEYRRFSIQTTYIPGGNGNGNVLFTWLRWQM